MTADEIIEKAKNKYPLSISFKGRLTAEDIKKLEEYCLIRCPSVYMDGSAKYSVRWLREEHHE